MLTIFCEFFCQNHRFSLIEGPLPTVLFAKPWDNSTVATSLNILNPFLLFFKNRQQQGRKVDGTELNGTVLGCPW